MDIDVLHYSDHTLGQHHADLQLADRPNVLDSGLPVSCQDSRSSYTYLALFIHAWRSAEN